MYATIFIFSCSAILESFAFGRFAAVTAAVAAPRCF